MSSLEVETIVAGDEACLISSPVEVDLLAETSLSFKAWLAESSGPAKEIVFEGTLVVDAYIAGLMRSDDGKLVLTKGGTIDGDLFVREAVIEGTVRGDIHGTERVELGSSARVIGDIETAQLQIDPGATFQGRCAFTPKLRAAREAA
jgi:cytoskeletal protein CcmA (bactofilin family)